MRLDLRKLRFRQPKLVATHLCLLFGSRESRHYVRANTFMGPDPSPEHLMGHYTYTMIECGGCAEEGSRSRSAAILMVDLARPLYNVMAGATQFIRVVGVWSTTAHHPRPLHKVARFSVPVAGAVGAAAPALFLSEHPPSAP